MGVEEPQVHHPRQPGPWVSFRLLFKPSQAEKAMPASLPILDQTARRRGMGGEVFLSSPFKPTCCK